MKPSDAGRLWLPEIVVRRRTCDGANVEFRVPVEDYPFFGYRRFGRRMAATMSANGPSVVITSPINKNREIERQFAVSASMGRVR